MGVAELCLEVIRTTGAHLATVLAPAGLMRGAPMSSKDPGECPRCS